MNGVCLWFNWERGYGFIKENETGESYFVHFSGIHADEFKKSGEPKFRKLEEGEPVTFEVKEGPDGRPCAVNVQRASAI
jgi:CspA family cold shock protein